MFEFSNAKNQSTSRGDVNSLNTTVMWIFMSYHCIQLFLLMRMHGLQALACCVETLLILEKP